MKPTPLLALLLTGSLVHAQALDPPLLKKPQRTAKDAQVYDVTNNKLDMSLLFFDPAECVANVEAEGQQSKETLTERKAKIPPGGYLAAAWARDTPVLASADKFEFLVVAPDGHQICRWTSPPTTPKEYTVGGHLIYSDVVLIPLPERLSDGTRVSVVEASVGKKFDYLIRP